MSAIAKGIGDFLSVGDAHYRISTNSAELLSTGQSLLQQDPDCRISLLVDIMDVQTPVPSLLAQASDMVRASRGGAVLTDYKSAMVLMLRAGERAIEEIGELQTAYGPLPWWSLA